MNTKTWMRLLSSVVCLLLFYSCGRDVSEQADEQSQDIWTLEQAKDFYQKSAPGIIRPLDFEAQNACTQPGCDHQHAPSTLGATSLGDLQSFWPAAKGMNNGKVTTQIVPFHCAHPPNIADCEKAFRRQNGRLTGKSG